MDPERNGHKPRDVRVAPGDAAVTAVFFRRTHAGTWEQFGDAVDIPRYIPFINSLPVDCDGEFLAGTIWHGSMKVFESVPMLCKKGDTFTFFFEDPQERR